MLTATRIRPRRASVLYCTTQAASALHASLSRNSVCRQGTALFWVESVVRRCSEFGANAKPLINAGIYFPLLILLRAEFN
jgi:hypothetical protein